MITATRKANHSGIYDPHTNLMHYPKIMQPTHFRWEQVNDEEEDTHTTNGVSQLTNGVNGVHLNGTSHQDLRPKSSSKNTIFPPVKPIVSRNFMDVGPNGISGISEEILAELPPECRKAFDEAKEKELEWKNRWGTEKQDGMRGELKIAFLGFPV
jgi:chromatin structure-remodeling complex protein RSC7